MKISDDGLFKDIISNNPIFSDNEYAYSIFYIIDNYLNYFPNEIKIDNYMLAGNNYLRFHPMIGILLNMKYPEGLSYLAKENSTLLIDNSKITITIIKNYNLSIINSNLERKTIYWIKTLEYIYILSNYYRTILVTTNEDNIDLHQATILVNTDDHEFVNLLK